MSNDVAKQSQRKARKRNRVLFEENFCEGEITTDMLTNKYGFRSTLWV
jgi:hypothetical protein